MAGEQLVACHPDMIEALFPMARVHLARSYAKGHQLVPDALLEDIRAKRRVLWLLINSNHQLIGAGVTAIFEMCDGRMLKIEHVAGGKLKIWSKMLPVIEEYAKAEGCVRVLSEVRPGWVRLMPNYAPVAMVLEKRL